MNRHAVLPALRQAKRGVCRVCGVTNKQKRVYCDEHRAIASASRSATIRKYMAGRSSTRIASNCAQCGREFLRYPSESTRRYCSYQCHLDSGGAFRAGAAAVEMRKKYGHKKDANHREIVEALHALGAGVIDISSLGYGAPDLVVWCRGAWHLADVKNPRTSYGRHGLNKHQARWADEWRGGPVYLLRSIEEAARLVTGDVGSLHRYPPDREPLAVTPEEEAFERMGGANAT